jgi:hypothetical protein
MLEQKILQVLAIEAENKSACSDSRTQSEGNNHVSILPILSIIVKASQLEWRSGIVSRALMPKVRRIEAHSAKSSQKKKGIAHLMRSESCFLYHRPMKTG